MKKAVLIVLILAVALVAGYYSWPEISGKVIAGVSCVDNDPENDIYVKGGLVFTNMDGQVFDDIFDDSCTPTGQQVEQRYCKTRDGRYYVSKQVDTCLNECINGTCKR